MHINTKYIFPIYLDTKEQTNVKDLSVSVNTLHF